MNVYAIFHQNIPHASRDRASFTFSFRIWTSAKPRPMTNDIWQSCGLELVNVSAYAIFPQHIPYGSESGLMENCIWQSIRLDLININVYVKCYQNILYG